MAARHSTWLDVPGAISSGLSATMQIENCKHRYLPEFQKGWLIIPIHEPGFRSASLTSLMNQASEPDFTAAAQIYPEFRMFGDAKIQDSHI